MTPFERAYYLWLLGRFNGLHAARGGAFPTGPHGGGGGGPAAVLLYRQMLKNYLAASGISKLQIGAGSDAPAGWLGVDVAPQSARVMYLDATKPYPFDDATFDYVHSEHMIEHVTWEAGSFMLRECRRVLKPGGTIRIATPDLEVLIGLYTRPDSPANRSYIKWITDAALGGVDAYRASFVINNAFRNWGHQFLYDGELLEAAMRAAGFTNVRRRAVGESDDENLRGIESHGRIAGNEEMVAFETMVFEGMRPA